MLKLVLLMFNKIFNALYSLLINLNKNYQFHIGLCFVMILDGILSRL